MDLKEALNKTKKQSEQIKVVRKPVGIACTDRPYSAQDINKTNNKPTTNRQQVGSKPVNKPTTNQQQTEDKTNTLYKTDNKPASKLATISATNRQQTDNKPETKIPFSGLGFGLERSCIIFIYNACKSNRNKETGPLSLHHISAELKTSTGAIKTTLQRLVSKGCLIRKSFKNGRSGWSNYELPDNIFNEILRNETDNKTTTIWKQTDNKSASKLTTELATNSPSSSSKDNKTTTTDLFEIDLEPLAPTGLTVQHATQILETGKISKEELQESIHAFAFDLYKNKKHCPKPLALFMKTLKVLSTPYAPPDGYISPAAQAKMFYVEQKRKQREAEELIEKQAFEEAFSEWSRGVGAVEMEKLVPISPTARMSSQIRLSEQREYFKKEVWKGVEAAMKPLPK